MLGAMTAHSLDAERPAAGSHETLLARGREAAAALSSDWQRLAGPRSEPMQSVEWALAAADSFHAGESLLTVAIRRGGDLVAVLPLVHVRRAGLRRWEVPGSEALGEPLRPLIADAAARLALVDAVLDLCSPVALSRIDDEEFVDALRARARGRALVFRLSGGSSLVADLDGDPQAHLQRCSPQRRKALRRNRRQLESSGGMSIDFSRPSISEVEPVLRAAFEVEARSWKGSAGSAVLARPAMFAFFRRYGQACAAAGRLRVRTLTVGGRTAAMQVAVEEGGRCFDLKIGYDPQFAKHSPGLTLTCEALADGARNGLRAHEFLGLAEDWQRSFATRERRFTSLVIYPASFAGVVAFTFDAAGALVRRARRALGT
jgi:CelD/BcsL family acetyltransferase involved in cellulose biosynthesis